MMNEEIEELKKKIEFLELLIDVKDERITTRPTLQTCKVR